MPKRGPKPTKKIAPKTKAKASAWAPPEHLSEIGREAWEHLVGLLREVGNLSRTDSTIIEAYALNVEMLREAHQSIKKDGVLITNAYGTRSANPACAMLNASTIRLKAIAYDLGLVPATSKYAASHSATNENQDDKWNDLLGIVG